MKLLKINGLYFIKKLISLIVRRRTKRGSTVLFSGQTAFLIISADFVTGFQKLFFHLKGL